MVFVLTIRNRLLASLVRATYNDLQKEERKETAIL